MSTLKDRLPATLGTERLVLAAPALAHAQAIAQLCNNKNVHKWMSRLPFPYGLDDARFFIEVVAADPAESSYAILLADGTLVGVVGLRDEDGQAPELGYWLGEPHWGHGYATEAAYALIAAARAAGVTRLRSRALLANTGSRNVLRKLGFIETGTAIDENGNLKGQELVLMSLDLPR